MPGKRHRPTAEDRLIVIRRALTGLAGGKDIHDVAVDLAPLHPEHDTSRQRSSWSWQPTRSKSPRPVATTPSSTMGSGNASSSSTKFRGRTEHHKSHYALRAAAMIRAGVAPDLLAEVSWWRTNDLWIWSWYALVIFARIASERTGDHISIVCAAIGARPGVTLRPD